MSEMKIGFKRGEKGFTLIEIMIVLSVLAILAAVIVPNVAGYLGRSKERAWDADRNVLQAAVDSYRTDIGKRSGNAWPTSDNKTIGKPVVTDNATDGIASGATNRKGIIDIGVLADESYLKSADAVKSARTGSSYHSTAGNTVSGSYVWYIDSKGVVHSMCFAVTSDGSASGWKDDFVSNVYP